MRLVASSQASPLPQVRRNPCRSGLAREEARSRMQNPLRIPS
ncbi:hypothetical protein IAE39_005206 [Pseudomonas sp. S37]|nr:hypothetical protein [Pseudomonas sp. S37]